MLRVTRYRMYTVGYKIGFINKKTGIPIGGGAKAHYDTK